MKDTKIAPYCSLMNGKAKKRTEIHLKRKLNIKSLSADNISYEL